MIQDVSNYDHSQGPVYAPFTFWGRAAMACVVMGDGRNPTPTEVRAFTKARAEPCVRQRAPVVVAY